MEEGKGILSTNGAKIIMTTALGDIKNVSATYRELCDGYLVKPIDMAKVIGLLEQMGFIRT